MNNRELRSTILAARAALEPELYQQKSASVCRAIQSLETWQNAETILFFLPFRREIDILPLLHIAWQEGKRVFAPRCVRQGHLLQAVEITGMDDLTEGAYGIREPKAVLPEADPEALDLVLVPGSVFDRQGGRLGYGAGYYDRFLLRCRPDTVRLAPHFALQLVFKLHQEEHDQLMHLLVNEEERICINRSFPGKIN